MSSCRYLSGGYTTLPCWSGGIENPDHPTDLRILAGVTDLGIVSILNILIRVQSHRRIVLQVNRLSAILRRLFLLRLVIGNRPDNNLFLWRSCRLSGLRAAWWFGRNSRSGSPSGLLLLTLFKHGWHDVFFLLLFPRPRSPWALQCSRPVLWDAAGVRLVLGRWGGVHGYVHDGGWPGSLLYGNSCWSGTLGKVRSKLGSSSAPWRSVCPSSSASIYCAIDYTSRINIIVRLNV